MSSAMLMLYSMPLSSLILEGGCLTVPLPEHNLESELDTVKATSSEIF